MNFANAIKNEQKWTRTENGAVALRTTGEKVLDLFSVVGALRDTDKTRIETLVAEAYNDNPDLTVKTLFYGRDIRGGGLGERETFKIAMQYLAKHHPESVRKNIEYFGEYGRFDDLYCLIDTPVEKDMWEYVKVQLGADMKALIAGKSSISLLAKWLKTADASSPKTRKLGIYTAKNLGMNVYTYKRVIRKLRKHLNIVETKMCENKWGDIQYDQVPGRASMIYRKAFKRHDEDRYDEFLNAVNKGEKKINASTIYPYDLVEKYRNRYWGWMGAEDPTVEALWNNLPNYVEPGTNAVVMADTSGSMSGRPLNSALGLAIYFAERNTGAYHNLWMTFSSCPRWQELRGETLNQKLNNLDMRGWQMNTNLQAAFELVLETAIKNHVSRNEMPKSIIVISDMEIDAACSARWTFYDQTRARFAQYGYEIPQIIFWNVNSRHDVFHADSTRKGVILCGGQSATTFKTLINSIGMTPVEYMMSILNDDRYKPIKA